jgi:glycine dehydrogenase subunit 1
MKFVSDDNIAEMLKTARVGSIDELFAGVEPKLGRNLNLPPPMSELELAGHMKDLSNKNRPLKNFIGSGSYDHYIPSAINHIISRSEFYTAYTPYQAEVSQGTLQAIYEFQTYICILTGMDVANASMYDGASALAEAAFLSCDATERDEIAVITALDPNYMRVLRTYCEAHGIQISRELTDRCACVIVQNPDFEGNVHDIMSFAEKAHGLGALLVVSVTEATSLALLEPPGSCGADIVAGEAQAFGNPVSFGGPMLGYMAVKREHLKRIPGRLSGMTTDSSGRMGFVLTLQAREQHIRRERASSNICSNQALCALSATVYLALMGKTGLRNVANLSYLRAHRLQERLSGLGFRLENSKPFYNEFVVKCPVNPEKIIHALAKRGIAAGADLGNHRMLVCCTEKNSETDIDEYVKTVEGML